VIVDYRLSSELAGDGLGPLHARLGVGVPNVGIPLRVEFGAHSCLEYFLDSQSAQQSDELEKIRRNTTRSNGPTSDAVSSPIHGFGHGTGGTSVRTNIDAEAFIRIRSTNRREGDRRSQACPMMLIS